MICKPWYYQLYGGELRIGKFFSSTCNSLNSTLYEIAFAQGLNPFEMAEELGDRQRNFHEMGLDDRVLKVCFFNGNVLYYHPVSLVK
jgi:hypothetical protein